MGCWLPRLVLLLGIFAVVARAARSTGTGDSKGKSRERRGQKSYFFLQDSKDGLCLFDGTYKRCSSDTLWYVTGPSGSYSIHKGDPENPKTEDNMCLSRTECSGPKSVGDGSVDLTVKSCSHCGASKWDVLGDATQGYVITQDGINCLGRSTDNSSYLSHCDDGHANYFNLHFITSGEIKTMNSEGAKMIQAAEENMVEAVAKYLAEGVDANSLDWNEQTALMTAASKGHIQMVTYLLEEKMADVNLSDKDHVSALMEAAANGHLDVVEVLAAAGGDVEATASSGVNALWLAASEGNDAIVKFLLEQATSADVVRADGVSALLAAATEGHTECVKILLEAGASVDTKDRDEITPLISASEKGHTVIVELLLAKKATVDVFSITEFSPLTLACAHGHQAIVEKLLKAGAQVNLQNGDNVTAIMYAASGGHEDVVKTLIKNKADVNKVHSHGGSALFEAATNGTLGVVEALLNAKADVLIEDTDGVNTAMTAASQGHVKVCEALLKRGIDINYVSASGGTALMFAAVGGHNATVDLLLSKGADPALQVSATAEYIERTAKDVAEGKEDAEPHKEGLSALMLAAQNGHLACVQKLVASVKSRGNDAVKALLEQKDAEQLSALAHAVKGKFEQVALSLVDLPGADANDHYVDEDTGERVSLLMSAVNEEHEELALRLIEGGADVDTMSSADNVTAVTQAAFLGQGRVVGSLVARGADLTVKNAAGAGPLMAAAAEGYSAIARTLVESGGADPNEADVDGTTPLMVAAARGHEGIVSTLLAAGADANLQNAEGHTALMFAMNGRSQVRSLQVSFSEMMDMDGGNETVPQSLQEALAEHSRIVSAVQRAGADAAVKDHENHRASDFDTTW